MRPMRCFFCGSLFLEGQDEKALSELLSSGTAQTVKDCWHIGEHELAGTSPRKRERVNPGGAAFIVFSRSLVQSIPVSRTPGFLLGCSLRNLSQNDMSTRTISRERIGFFYGAGRLVSSVSSDEVGGGTRRSIRIARLFRKIPGRPWNRRTPPTRMSTGLEG